MASRFGGTTPRASSFLFPAKARSRTSILWNRESCIGLPQTAIPLALLTFNVGVEIGQLLFIAAVFLAVNVLRRLPIPNRPWLPYAAPYAIGTIAMFWVIERVGAFF